MSKVVTSVCVAVLSAGLVAGCAASVDDPSAQAERIAAKAEAPGTSVGIAADIANANTDADEKLHLLSRTYIGDGSEMAEFYEPRPGVVLFSMAGRPSSGVSALDPRDARGRSASEIWNLLNPGVALPSAIGEAVQRGYASGLTEEAPSAPPAGAISASPSPSPRGAKPMLTQGYCGQTWPSYWGCGDYQDVNYQWCALDQGGNDWANGTGLYYDWYNVCPEIGTVTLNVSPGGAWTVFQNTYRWTATTGGKFNVNGTVTTDGPALYNFMGYFLW